jgi:S1-C subfamily serine protease
MVAEFVVQVVAGVTVLVVGGLSVRLWQRAKGLTRAGPVFALAAVTSLVAVALAIAYLVDLVIPGVEGPIPSVENNIAGVEDDVTILDSLAPIVARVEGSGVDRRRGFFTPQGYLVAPAHSLAVGMTVTASWAVGNNDETRTASVAHLGGCGHAVALLNVDGGPRSALPLGTSSSLQPGDTVTRFVPAEPKSGSVVQVGATPESSSGCHLLITTRLNNSGAVRPGDAGAPVLNSSGRVVAMLAMNDVGQGLTWSIPIEGIREAFPWAFEVQASPISE